MKGRTSWLIGAAAAALLVAGWFFWHRPAPVAPGAGTSPTPRSAGAGANGAATPGKAGGPSIPVSEENRSHLADDLNSPDGDIRADLRILDGIFQQYRSALHEADPVGENAEITAALAGRNRLGFAFIPPDHPAINSRGELCDRWGTPFFFHSLSGTQMEIRSAGPDRRLWTADDVVVTPGLYVPQL